MKKIIILAFAALLSAGIASAQTMEEAIDLYNTGSTMLGTGDNKGALNYFEQALTMGETIGPEATELISNCKDIIPKLHLQIAKDYVEAQNTDMAVAEIEKTIALAGQYGETETMQEANELLPQILLQNAGRGQTKEANKQLSTLYLLEAVKHQKAKNWAGVIENAELSASYEDNYNAQQLIGVAALQLGQYEKAISGFENYLTLQPNAKNKNQMYYYIATAYNSMGNKDMACTYFKMIMNDPQLGEYATHMVKNELKCA